jgi:hypothetical protein
MKTTFSRNAIEIGRLFLFICFAGCVLSALAGTIDQAGAPVDGGYSDSFLGTPLPDYTFPWGPNPFMSNLSPGDPGFFDLGIDPGSFLVTGNTYFNFTGDQQISVFQFSPAPGAGPLPVSSTVLSSPEPGTGWLALAMPALAMWVPAVLVRSRRYRSAQSGGSVGAAGAGEHSAR